jgi:hypothetical protein
MCMFLQVYKHGSSSQITTNSSPKPNKISFFKCGFGVTPRVKHGGTNKISIEMRT